MAQQQLAEEKPQETEIIVIEERVDHNGNKTVNKTIRKGNFTQEEIDEIVRKESAEDADHSHAAHHDESNSGYLGVMIEGAGEEQGVLVTDVVDGSPAEKAGLQADDIIKAVAGQPVNSPSELVNSIKEFSQGETVDITYSREGSPSSVSATLAKRSDHEKVYKIINKEEFEDTKPKRKLGVYLGHSEQGVKINDIAEGGIAGKVGIQSGDIITSFDGKAVTTSEELVDAIQSAEVGKEIKMTYMRDGEEHDQSVKFDF